MRHVVDPHLPKLSSREKVEARIEELKATARAARAVRSDIGQASSNIRQAEKAAERRRYAPPDRRPGVMAWVDWDAETKKYAKRALPAAEKVLGAQARGLAEVLAQGLNPGEYLAALDGLEAEIVRQFQEAEAEIERQKETLRQIAWRERG